MTARHFRYLRIDLVDETVSGTDSEELFDDWTSDLVGFIVLDLESGVSHTQEQDFLPIPEASEDD